MGPGGGALHVLTSRPPESADELRTVNAHSRALLRHIALASAQQPTDCHESKRLRR
jgi:hypothetical protein